MARYTVRSIIPIILSTVFLCLSCDEIWVPPINDEYAIQESGERYPLTAVGVFRGEPLGEGYRIQMGFAGTGTTLYPYPPRGTGPAFLCSFSADNDRQLSPGRYSLSSERDTYVPGTFFLAEVYTAYNMDDFEPVFGRLAYETIGGSVNIYSYSPSRMHLSWSLEVYEYIDTGSEPDWTGVQTIVDGHYNGEYAFYDVPLNTEHKGFCVKGKFHPLTSASLIEEPITDAARRLFIRLAGPDAGISDNRMSGTDTNIEIQLIVENENESVTGHYPLVREDAASGLVSNLVVYQDYDFDELKSRENACIYRPISGYLDIHHLENGYLDIIWSVEMEECSASPGHSSYELNGAYSGEYTLIEKSRESEN